MPENLESKLFHPSSRPAGHGITIGTPRLYDLSAALLFGSRRRAYGTLVAAADVRRGDRALEVTAYARRKAGRLPNCRFQPGAAESLGFPDAAFDVVVSSLMVHHLPED